ncbi:MAG: dephospho-CoA kinase [Candidatus Aminicenantaceae bacterium]
MLIVALTGGIAVGKSVVANILKELGCYIHHSDKIAHDLSMPGEPAWEKIVAHFGEKILKKNKTINRAQLGKIIFSNKKEQAFLNELIHPLVFEKKKEIIKTLKKEGRYKIFVSEAALTIEAGFADFFDKIITTHCRKEVQIDRLMKRDQISRAEALNKIKSQMPPEEKLKYADYIIDSSGSLQSTIEQTERVYRNLMLDYEMKYAVKNENS